MPRTQISIKLDADLLERVDRLAELAGSNRTAVIEQAVEANLPDQEWYYDALENPAVRAIHTQLTRPSMLRLIAKLAKEEVSEEDIARVVRKAPIEREAAKSRVTERRAKSRKLRVEGA